MIQQTEPRKKAQHAAEQDRPEVRHKRATFRGWAADIDPNRWVFLDATGVNTAMARRYGRAARAWALRCRGRTGR